MTIYMRILWGFDIWI